MTVQQASQSDQGGPPTARGPSRDRGAGPERLQLSDRLLVASVVLLPLQKAFTVSVGFPLKPTEILLLLALGTGAFRQRRRLWDAWRVAVALRRTVIILGALVVASSIWALTHEVPSGPYPGFTRSLSSDLILYMLYGLIVIFAWTRLSLLPVRTFERAFAASTYVAFAGIVLQYVLFESQNTTMLRRFGYELVVGAAYGSPLPRNGTFFEGNYLGFYAVVAVFVAVRSRRRLAVILGLVCLAYSQSTSAAIGILVGGLISAFVLANPRWRFRMVASATVVVVGLYFVGAARHYLTFQLQKLLGVPIHSGMGGNSTDIRSAKVDIAARIMEAHPLFGVGPGRSGAWFQQYLGSTQLPPSYFSGKNRFIVENSYMQIGAELGVVALLVTGIILWLSVRFGKDDPVAIAIVVAVAVMLNASPSWTTLTIWYALGFVAAVGLHRAKRQSVIDISANHTQPARALSRG